MSDLLKFNKSTNQNEENSMTQEDFEFWEDMMFISDLATESEVDCVCFDDPSHVVTKKGEIKVNPAMKDTYNYIQNKNKQKMKEGRKRTFKLV